jgi:hypothetical protein
VPNFIDTKVDDYDVSSCAVERGKALGEVPS